MKRLLFITVLALGLMAPTVGSLAHHGWSWTTGGNIDLTGIIKTVRLGNPHGVLKIDVEGEEWTAEVGQPWRNARAGLKDGDLAEGVEIRVIGEPAADMSERLVKVGTAVPGQAGVRPLPRARLRPWRPCSQRSRG